MNPSGSVKDRAAKEMLLDGIERGLLTKDKTIIDATSGNTGIAFAMMGAALGYKVKLCIPSNACIERKRLLRVYGARIIETEPLEGIDGAIMTATEPILSRITRPPPRRYGTRRTNASRILLRVRAPRAPLRAQAKSLKSLNRALKQSLCSPTLPFTA